MYIFYPDLYWFLQSVVILYGLKVTQAVIVCKVSVSRVCIGTIVAATVETLIVIAFPSMIVGRFLIHMVVMPGVVALVLRPHNMSMFVKEWLLCYMATWLLDGCVEWIFNETGWSGIVPICVCAVSIYFIIWMGLWIWRKRPEYYEVELEYDGVVLCTKGFLDSGNRFYDPVFGKPVSIVSSSFMEPILKRYERPMMPALYHTVAGINTTQIMILDTLRIHGKGMEYEEKEPRIGLSDIPFFGKPSCQLLIHKEHMTTRGEK